MDIFHSTIYQELFKGKVIWFFQERIKKFLMTKCKVVPPIKALKVMKVQVILPLY